MTDTLVNTFKPLGPAPIQDPFRARLNIANPWGSGIATGAIASLCMVQDESTADGILYAGAAAGGVWGRAYTGATDSWDEWKWLSSASGYEGAQSISKIKVSTGSKWLVSAQGATSSWNSFQGDIKNPLQVAERLDDGSLKWLANDGNVQDKINGKPITALEIVDDIVVIGSATGLYISSIDATGKLATVVAAANLSETTPNQITSIAAGQSGRLYAAVLNKGIYTTTVSELKLDPAGDWQLIDSSQELSTGKSMLRLATSQDPSTGNDILFLGTGIEIRAAKFDGYDQISKVIYNENITSSSWVKANVTSKIGSSQVKFHSSFASDPTNPNRVFAGGNWGPTDFYLGYTGVIVATDFSEAVPTLENFFPSKENETTADGTAPHADSRDIVFLKTASGQTRIIESDDGGIYIKDLDKTKPWQGLNDGLRTTEGFYSDWSNIGNLAITAMQDNSVAVGRFGSQPGWLNVTGGDGAVARFDDGVIGSDGISRAYFSWQAYGGGLIQENSYDAQGILLRSDSLNLSIIDQYGNNQDWLDYENKLFGEDYPFYLPAETSDTRAGDVVLAGSRNIYEQVIPHWNSVTLGEMNLVPLLGDTNNLRFFTDVIIGSDAAKSFTKQKPFSWDTLYTSFSEASQAGLISKVYGRQASTGIDDDWINNKDAYMLKDLSANLPEITKNRVITGLAFNPSKPSEIWATVAKGSVIFTYLNKPVLNSYLIYSANAGQDWQVIAESGKNGIPDNATLQQITYAPATAGGSNAELYIGGYGGVWHSSIDVNNDLSPFKSVSWEGVEANGNFNMWNTNLEYDPVDDVIIASIMAQGAWLLNRSNKDLAPAEAIAPGLRINNIILPQELSSLKSRKKRDLNGSIGISLQRDDINKDLDVSVDLIMPSDYAAYIQFKSREVIDNRIKLSFPKGVNDLSLELNTVLPYTNIPDKLLNLKLDNAYNASISAPSAAIFLYATHETIALNQEAPGVFYSNKTILEADRVLPSQAQKLEILMPRASLRAGDQLFWFIVDADGSISDGLNKLLPSDAGYIALARQRFNLLATSNFANDPRAFSPNKAAAAFSNPDAVLSSEGVAIGDLSSAAGTMLTTADRFAFALQDSNGNISVSTKDFKIDSNPALDNTVVFGSSGTGYQVVLAPADGELFVVDELLFYAESNAGTSEVVFNLDVARFGYYQSGYGLFRVDNQYGGFSFIDGSLRVNAQGNVDPLMPGTVEYAKEAFKRSQSNVDGVTGLPIPGFAQSTRSSITLAKGNSYGIYITPGKVLTTVDQLTDLSQILFSIKDANLNQQLQQVSMGTGYFAFEDMGWAGDRDFNDMLFLITPAASPIA